MKVIYTMKNMMIQEIQHSVEFKSIELMNINVEDSIQANRELDSNEITESDSQLQNMMIQTFPHFGEC
jgi:hypothetical protein